ncbi:MAG: SUMF1/EgtB/PvdO family nonheme iron enzyme, partial [Candidatus Latescibacter sp.]|nr:SUMF1/EgtB/PvdO family nonheme iron enzyme [Candidatus Latescibacter sp.]
SGQTYISLSDSIDSYNQCWIRYSNNTFSVVLGYEDWPVVSVTWFGSKAFAEYYGWDLPREAEWEYACRSGQSYKYGTNDGKISSFQANYDYYGSVGPYHPVIVGSYRSNSFGLGDMSGNVWEWCSDWYGVYDTLAATDPTGPQSGALKVIRGGGWYGTDWVCRSTYRSPYTPGIGSLMIGFRVVSRQL